MKVRTIPAAHKDERGEIRNVIPTISVIKSFAGAVRSNHFHRLGWHSLYVVSGKMLYLEKRDGIVSERVLGPGEEVYTGPGIPHRTEFMENTILLSHGPTSSADKDAHDADTVAVEW